MGVIIGIILGILIFGGLGIILKRNKKPKASAIKFVNQLFVLGYFKYADAENIEDLKNEMIDNYDPNNELISIWDDDTDVPLDFRYYFCDGEAVFEEGGFIGMLEEIKPTLNKIGLKIVVDKHFEDWDSNTEWLNHRITINGTEYVIFKNFKGYGWGEAALRFAEIINKEAELQSVNERIYLASGGNDGRLIFLTTELYNYIYTVYKNPLWKPLDSLEWMKAMSIKSRKTT